MVIEKDNEIKTMNITEQRATDSPAPSLSPSPSPTPEPEPDIEGIMATTLYVKHVNSELVEFVEQINKSEMDRLRETALSTFSSALTFDFTDRIPTRIRPSSYLNLGENYETFDALNHQIDEAINTAFEQTKQQLSLDFPWSNVELDCDNQAYLSWQAHASLYKVYRSDLADILREAVTISVGRLTDNRIVISVYFPKFDDIADYSELKTWFTARFTFFYLNTYFDENGKQRDTTYQPLPDRYISELKLPVEQRFESGIKPGWYKARSSGTRRHMGTDIRGSGKSQLYSCTDGKVVCTGYDVIAGNYVCIRDYSGYEYNYYHMYELSKYVVKGDAVKAGQVIGLMGNTGNSAANHLHLAIIDPNGRHIDPYMVLSQAGFGKNAVTEEAYSDNSLEYTPNPYPPALID